MAEELQDPRFVNKVVKQGNSLCIRIPSSVVKEIALKEGDDIAIGLHKLNYEKYQKYYEEGFLENLEKVPELRKMSGIKKRLFASISFDILKRSNNPNPKVEEKNRKIIALEYKKEIGDRLFGEYLRFGDIVNSQINIIEKDGSIVTKKGFR